MPFDSNAVLQKLHDFHVKNVRIDENFDAGTKRLKASNILVTGRGKRLLTGCTDERAIKSLIDPKTGEEKDINQYVVVRCAGGVSGLVDVVRNVKVTIQRHEILQVLVENEVLVANHIDTHAKEGELTGCGYGSLRELPESGSIFDRPPVLLEERMGFFEEMGSWRLVLEGDHVAEGLVVNPISDKALDPSAPEANHNFFSLDIGIYKEILHWVEGALGFGEEALRTMLVKLARNELATVFILSNAAINEAIYIERGDDEDRYFAGVLHEGLAEFKEREASVMHVLEERMTGKLLGPHT